MKVTEGQEVQYVRMYYDGRFRSVLTPTQAAEKLGFTENYVRQLCDMGKLIATKYNGRWWIFEQQYKNTYVYILPHLAIFS